MTLSVRFQVRFIVGRISNIRAPVVEQPAMYGSLRNNGLLVFCSIWKNIDTRVMR